MAQRQAASGPPASTGSKIRAWLSCTWRGLSALVLLLLIGVAIYAAFRFIPDHPVRYDNMPDHFKYGSTGGERVTGIPYWMWQAMPLVCADTLKAIAGDRLAPDYLERVATYTTDQDGPAKRRALSREGYKALGFMYEQDKTGEELNLPIGMSQRRHVGLDRVYINCSVCHTSTVRKDAAAAPTVVLGMPANRFNLYNFEHFVFQCTKNARPTRIAQLDIIPEMQSLGADLGPIDRYAVYPIAIWAVRDVMGFMENVAGFSVRQPDWGPGRNDTFTNNKIFLFGEDWRKTMPDWWTTKTVDPEGIGIVDWPSIWLQGPRKLRADGKPMQLHWDGNNDKVEERNLNASLATGALPPVIDHESIECIEQWLEKFEPPKYMFDIDAALAQKGKKVYDEYCAECHGRDGRNFEGKKVGFVTPIAELGTDPYRLNNYTETLAVNMGVTYAEEKRERRSHACPGGAVYQPTDQHDVSATGRLAALEKEDQTYRYKHYRKTNGYVNMPLDGIWLRAPYLHNGSVPTLRDLLKPGKDRPQAFYRGNDIYDPKNVGFVSTDAQDAEGRKYFRFETDVPGNDNKGHEGPAFGTTVRQPDKDALLEYLKTF